MELEKTLIIAAPRQHVWDLLLDPKIMAGCVPGTQSVEVVSDVEYLAEVKVKISFISARFKIKTVIVESRPPEYLRIEGTGEDSSVASSMKQTSELFLTEMGAAGTELRIKAKADVLGRLGSFGLSVMKTKADRMWDEFGANFSAVALRSLSPMPPVTEPAFAGPGVAAVQDAPADGGASEVPGAPRRATWWRRVVGASPVGSGAGLAAVPRLPTDIYVELHLPRGVLKILWPASAASDAARWLKDIR